MGDGSHMGVMPTRALETIIGGAEEPAESEQRTPAEMRVWILAAPDEADTYDDAVRCTAKLLLELVEAHPELQSEPADGSYDYDADPDSGTMGTKPEFVRARGLYKIGREDFGIEWPQGLTGFQWGYAVNVVRFVLGIPEGPNPAIISIDTDGSV